jgi:tight adherence protein B
MTRTLLALIAVATAAVGVWSASAAAAGELRASPLAETRFPERAYVVSLPQGSVAGEQNVRVTENGERVSKLTALPATRADRRELAIVLAIDTSSSMRGEPVRAATEAARALAARRNPQQQLAVLTFNAETRLVLPFTSDEAEIERALATPPPVAYYTRTYDAIEQAVAAVERANLESATIVLLSDGQELDSRSSLEAAVAAAQRKEIRIFTVGLDSRFFDPAALEALSRRTGGAYRHASDPAALTGIFDELGAQLSNEYVIRYRSLAGPEERVRVRIAVAGVAGAAEDVYVTPALNAVSAPPYRASRWAAFWRSSLALILVGLAAASLVGTAVVILVMPRGDRPMLARIGQFVTLAGVTGTRRAAGDMTPGAGPEVKRSRWSAWLEETLEIAQIPVTPGRVVAGTLAGMALAVIVLVAAIGPLAAVLALLVPVGVRAFLASKLAKTRREFVDQLPDNLSVLASALRAGHSLVGALSVVVDDAPEPARREFRRVIGDEQRGVPLEDAFDEVARRMDCRDLEQVAVVAALGRDTGGNTAEVLDRVVETIRERSALRRLVRTLTAQGRMSRWIVSFLPGFLVIGIMMINPGYLSPLWDNGFGRLLLMLGVVMVVSGSLVIRRIVNIKV